MIAKDLYEANRFDQRVKYLKQKAPLYPEIYFEEAAGQLWATTMVKFTYNGVAYKRHHVRGIIPTHNIGRIELQKRLFEDAEKCISLAVPCPFDDIIGVVK